MSGVWDQIAEEPNETTEDVAALNVPGDDATS